MKPENIAAVHVGVASHNLFDLAFALVLAADSGAVDRVQFEMLEGMANPQRRALFELTRNLLLYAPVCHKEDFINAIGYLIRRLDKNTGPENFLRYAFRITPDSPEWHELRRQDSSERPRPPSKCRAAPRRTQNRQLPPRPTPPPSPRMAKSRERARHRLLFRTTAIGPSASWPHGRRAAAPRAEIPLVVAGEEIRDGATVHECLDPSRPGVVVGRYRQANAEDVGSGRRLRRGRPGRLAKADPAARYDRLGRVADELRRRAGPDRRRLGRRRKDTARVRSRKSPRPSTSSSSTGPTPAGGRKCPRSRPPKGVVAVVSPWNFPIAIPCGGVAAALAAGNTVILKPASDAVLMAWELCQCFWRGGRVAQHAAIPPLLRRTGRTKAGQPLRRRCRDPHRRHRNRPCHAPRQAVDEPHRRNRRQNATIVPPWPTATRPSST